MYKFASCRPRQNFTLASQVIDNVGLPFPQSILFLLNYKRNIDRFIAKQIRASAHLGHGVDLSANAFVCRPIGLCVRLRVCMCVYACGCERACVYRCVCSERVCACV